MATNTPPETPLVSQTQRMARAELLAAILRQHLLTLPVHQVESHDLLKQLEALLATMRAEIRDWQRLAATCGADVLHASFLIQHRKPAEAKFSLLAGVAVGSILARSTGTLSELRFVGEELFNLPMTWPGLRPATGVDATHFSIDEAQTLTDEPLQPQS